MKSEYWHQRWLNNEIGFHRADVNPLLVKYIATLNVSGEDRIFVPLCGKTRDIIWLLNQGYKVVGVELSELAVSQLFSDMGITPEVQVVNDLLLYRSHNIDIFAGNYFSLTTRLIGNVSAIYDRAALVALPENLRTHYIQHLIEITHSAPLLLITYKYDQQLMAGPPFSVDEHELWNHFNHYYELILLCSQISGEKLKNTCNPTEEVRLLKPKQKQALQSI